MIFKKAGGEKGYSILDTSRYMGGMARLDL